jgi:hypothetical protein
MAKRIGLFTVIFLAVFGVAIAPVSADDLVLVPFDPGIVIGPGIIAVLDPCFGADVILELKSQTYAPGSDVNNLYSQLITADLDSGGTTVGRVMIDYQRYKDASGDYFVTLKDTFMFDGLTAFGRSSNYKLWIDGAQGVITQLTTKSGTGFKTNTVEIRYTYKYTTGPPSKLEACIWLD